MARTHLLLSDDDERCTRCHVACATVELCQTPAGEHLRQRASCVDTSEIRVLVVDDDPTIRELLSLELGCAGHDVELAADGNTRLAAIRQDRPDALVLDVMMPAVSGRDVLTDLRADDAYADLPIVLLSARDLPDDVRHGYALGASLVISKPCDSEQLLLLLEVLRSSRSRAAQ